MTDCAPVVLFAFNRADHTAATLEALSRNRLARDSDLTVFCDGARDPSERPKVEAVRELVKRATGFRKITVVERPENLGLARSVIGGVNQILASHESLIVVEDDLITAPFFLEFMNEALQRYADDRDVWSVCGYAYPVWGALPESFFLPGAHPWGWATWRRSWALFEHDQRTLLRALHQRDLVYEFDIAGSFPHTAWLVGSAEGKGDSWALRWIGSGILNGGLTLYPPRSLVHNEGMDASGTHAPDTRFYDSQLAKSPPALPEGPPRMHEEALRLVKAHHTDWRRTWGRRERLYYGIASLLPRSIEKKVYSAIVRRSLRRRGYV